MSDTTKTAPAEVPHDKEGIVPINPKHWLEEIEISDLNTSSCGVLDITKGKALKATVDENMTEIVETIGSFFTIQYGEFSLPVKLVRLNKSRFSDVSTWTLQSIDLTIEDNVIRYAFGGKFEHVILSISFGVSDAMITMMQKTSGLTGTNVMMIALSFSRFIGCKRVCLGDLSVRKCPDNINHFNFAMYELLKKGRTFFQKFGFVFDADHNYPRFNDCDFGSTENMQKTINKCVDKIRQIPLSAFVADLEMVVTKFEKPKDAAGKINTLAFFYYLEGADITLGDRSVYRDPLPTAFVETIKFIIGLAKNSAQPYLADFIIELAATKCSEFDKVVDFLSGYFRSYDRTQEIIVATDQKNDTPVVVKIRGFMEMAIIRRILNQTVMRLDL